MIIRKLFVLGMLLAFSMLGVGCASTGKTPYLEGKDLVPLKSGTEFKAPVDGWFLSNDFYKYEVDKC